MGRSRPTPRLVAISAALVVLTGASWACAGDDEELQSAIGRIEGAQYADAAQRLERLLDPRGDSCPSGPELSPSGCRLTNVELIKRAREQYIVALYALGRVDEVRAQLEAILVGDPTFQANPTLFPQRLMNLFVEVRGRRAEKIALAAREAAAKAQKERVLEEAQRKQEFAYIAALEKQASEERTLESRSRLYAMVPFGVGQFQNEELGLGLFFGVSQLLAGGTSIVFAVARENFLADARANDVDLDQARSQGETLATLNYIAFGIFATSAVAGVVEAQLSFEESVVEVHKRPLPARPAPAPRPAAALAPAIVPVAGGAALGARGSF